MARRRGIRALVVRLTAVAAVTGLGGWCCAPATAAIQSASRVWAAGSTDPLKSKTQIIRWNGHKWVRTAAPSPGSNASLSGITSVSARSAWAVGSTGPQEKPHPLLVHWNGKSWKRRFR